MFAARLQNVYEMLPAAYRDNKIQLLGTSVLYFVPIALKLIAELEQQVSQLSEKKANMEGEIRSLRLEVSQSKNEISNLSGQISTSQQKASKMENDLKSSQQQVSQLREQRANFEGEIRSLRSKVAQSKDEITDLSSQLSMSQRKSGEMENDVKLSRQQVSQLREQLTSSDRKLAEQKNNMEEKIRCLRSEVGRSKDEITDLSSQLSMSQQKASEMENDVKLSRQQVSQLREQLTSSDCKLAEQKNNMEEKIRYLRSEVGRSKDEIIDLSSQLSMCQQKASKMENSLKSSHEMTTGLQTSVQDLCSQLSTSHRNASEKESDLNKIVESLRERDENSKQIVSELRDRLSSSERKFAEEKDGMERKIHSHIMRQVDSNGNIASLESSVRDFRNQLSTYQRQANERENNLNEIIRSLRKDLHSQETSSANLKETARRGLSGIIQCEFLYSCGHMFDAAKSLSDITDATSNDPMVNKLIVDWRSEFTRRSASRLQTAGDEAGSAGNYDEALAAYSAALSIPQSHPDSVLMSWTRIKLLRGSPTEAVDAASKFPIPTSSVYQAIFDVLGGDDNVTEAIESIQRMEDQSPENVRSSISGIRQWCIDKVVNMGDKAMKGKNHDGAIKYFSSALSLDPIANNNIICKCCEARVGLWEGELKKAEKDIERDPLSFKGYERKHDVLHHLRRYSEALGAFETMRSGMKNSPDPNIRKRSTRYIDTAPLFRKVIEETIHDIPRVLVNLDTGNLCDRARQVASFEGLPIYAQLRSEMTTRGRLDYARVRMEVKTFFEYVMFSHTWGQGEPTFQMLNKRSINNLPKSPGNNKLRGFRNIVRSRGFRWLWSDTCCIDQTDKSAQQESIVAMFRWYRRSVLTVVHLFRVLSDSDSDDLLWNSVWNTRGWTYQEYVASPVIQFYTEDWKSYRGLEIWNHKDSPIIRAEMERVTNLSTQRLMTLEPGLDRVWEKLHLASRRETTRKEDIAYCLFGIFGVSIQVNYGEGKEEAIYRLLQTILAHPDNVTLLSWTGKAGNKNSYLPTDLTVYNYVAPTHLPPPIETNEMESMSMALKSPSTDVPLFLRLYDQLSTLPSLSLISGRLKLPSFVFPVTTLRVIQRAGIPSGERRSTYRASTAVLGDVEIRTEDDLSAKTDLLLIHPWITPLLDEDFSNGNPLFDQTVRALRLIVRLRQPFGALLLAPSGRVQKRRVATDCFIHVQIRAETTVPELMNSVDTVDME